MLWAQEFIAAETDWRGSRHSDLGKTHRHAIKEV